MKIKRQENELLTAYNNRVGGYTKFNYNVQTELEKVLKQIIIEIQRLRKKFGKSNFRIFDMGMEYQPYGLRLDWSREISKKEKEKIKILKKVYEQKRKNQQFEYIKKEAKKLGII